VKINIGYKLFRKIINRKWYLSFLTFFVILELLTFLKVDNEQKELRSSINFEKKEIKLKDAIEELKEKEIAFITAKKENETYLIDVKIEGTKEEFMKKISSLDNYKINDYNIDFNQNIIVGRLTLNYTQKVNFRESKD
jgi:hypothetical protein